MPCLPNAPTVIFTFPTTANQAFEPATSAVEPTVTSVPPSGRSDHHFGRSILYGAVAAAVLVTLTVGGLVVSGGQNNSHPDPAPGDVAKVVPTPPPTRKPDKPPAPTPATTANGQAVYRIGDCHRSSRRHRAARTASRPSRRICVCSRSPPGAATRAGVRPAPGAAPSAQTSSIQVADAGSGGHAFCLSASTVVAVSATEVGTTAIKGARAPALQLGCQPAGSSGHGFLTYLLLSGESFDHLEIQTAPGVVALVRP